MLHCLRVDRGAVEEGVGRADPQPHARLAFLARGARLSVGAPQATFWLVLRGSARMHGREGGFLLRAGEWIAFGREAVPALAADRGALVLGLLLPVAPGPEPGPFHLGRGRLARGALRDALRLWRALAGGHSPAAAALAALLAFIGAAQAPFEALVGRCPGRSPRRKRQLFARLQRARLHLDGHAGQPVRLAELAALCNISIWHFTKTFHAVYGEGPREAIARLRLEQASALLEATRLPVGEVGAACGFENPCSFSRAFRARYGTTASRWRAAHQGSRAA